MARTGTANPMRLTATVPSLAIRPWLGPNGGNEWLAPPSPTAVVPWVGGLEFVGCPESSNRQCVAVWVQDCEHCDFSRLMRADGAGGSQSDIAPPTIRPEEPVTGQGGSTKAGSRPWSAARDL
ncbi:hypothetical protein VTH06DRAFT_2802 [Thermothelomyces fergusii]